MQQIPLLVSPRHPKVLKHLVDIYGMQKNQAEQWINQHLPHLLNPNYKGHTKAGKPCKSLKIGRKK